MKNDIVTASALTGAAATAVAAKADASSLTSHTGNTSNPHSTTAAQVGAYSAGQVDTLLAAKATTAALTSHTGASSGAHAASAIAVTPAGNITTSTVQAALAELDAKKLTWGPLASGDNTGATDTAALQAAIDAAAAAGGGVILLKPTGATPYKVTTLNMKQGVWIVNPFASTASYFSPQPVRIYGVGGAGTDIIDCASAQWSWGLTGLYISGSGTAKRAIRIRNNSKQIGIRGCMIQSVTDQGILIEAGSGIVTITDTLVVSACGGVASFSGRVGALEVAGNDCWVTNCEIGAGVSAATATHYAIGCLVSGTANTFSYVVTEFADHAWFVSGSQNAFIACRGDLSMRNGFHVYSAGGAPPIKNMFVACNALDNGLEAANTYSGWYVENATGNVFTGCRSTVISGSASHKYAFSDTSAYGDPSGNKVNSWIGCMGDFTTGEWDTGAQWVGSIPQFPQAVYRPSTTGAATRSVAKIGLLILDDSSATTITNFTDGYHTQELRVMGTSNTTIANNSTIKTNTGANKTLASNKVYRFTNVAGVWIEDA